MVSYPPTFLTLITTPSGALPIRYLILEELKILTEVLGLERNIGENYTFTKVACFLKKIVKMDLSC